MSDLKTEISATITDIKTRASIRRRAPVTHIELTGRSTHGTPFQWTVIAGWYDGPKFNCEASTNEDLAIAVDGLLAKLKPEPDISEYIGRVSA